MRVSAIGRRFFSQSIDRYGAVDPAQCRHWKVTALRLALKRKWVSEDEPLAMFWNVEQFRHELRQARAAFPGFTHTIAAKANLLLPIFHEAGKEGAGVECASLGELTQALAAEISPGKIVFDSPTKTAKELKLALQRRVHVNVDNFQELHRLDTLLNASEKGEKVWGSQGGVLGIRVNTEVGQGNIKTHSTSLPWSKFGIGINQYRKELLQAYATRPWLRMIHCHVGSQGCPLDLIAQGIRRTIDLALEINKNRPQQIQMIDIGGGLPVNFQSEVDTPAFSEWAAILKKKCPELFSGEFRVLTEHGRRYLAKAGFILSRVEYTKEAGGRRIALQHAGADLCVRTVYHPEQWPLRVTVFDQDGVARPTEYAAAKYPGLKTDIVEQDVAGPCCIAGDVIAHLRPLPRIEQGDWLIVHDVGAYYHSSWSYYNARQAPACYFFQPDGQNEHSGELWKVKDGADVTETLRHFTP